MSKIKTVYQKTIRYPEMKSMKEELPEIQFNQHGDIGIEVMNFKQLLSKLVHSKSHNPFTAHKIKFYFILLVTKNSYTHFVDFKSYELTAGSTLFVAKNQIHHFNEGLEGAEGIGIVFDHLFVDKYYFMADNFRLNRIFNYHIESPILHRRAAADDNLIELIHQLHLEYILPNKFAKSEILAAMLRVLLLKVEREKDFHSTVIVNQQWLETFNNFRALLEKNYSETRNSRAYAARLLVSYKFLNDVVKKLTGKTVKAFIDEFVTIEIKRSLASTSLSVNEISYETGFNEPTNMIKFFRKHTGMTPHRFRQKL